MNGTGGEIAKKGFLFTLRHTGQALGALVLMGSITISFAEPAIKQYVENTVATPLSLLGAKQEAYQIQQRSQQSSYRKKQRSYRDRQKLYRETQAKKVNEVAAQQKVILEKLRVGEILDAEARSDLKQILRSLERNNTR